MPATTILVYREADGSIPLHEWMTLLGARQPRARAKCAQRILQLSESGHELRRPLSAPLGNGIHELRVQVGAVNYRILYFFNGRRVAVLSHGITKEDVVPPTEIERAIARMKRVQADAAVHTAMLEMNP
jgi:putative component of toxin-antitoxin plasmid stabilization module